MAESFFKTATSPTLQGWQAPGSLDFQAAFLRAGGWALPRTDAFPDAAKLRARLEELKASMRDGAKIGLDLRGLRDSADSVMTAAREAGVAFLLHTAELPPSLAMLRHTNMPRLVAVQNPEEGARAKAGGAAALLARACDVASLRSLGLPVMAVADTEAEARQAMADGAIGLQPRTPGLLDASPLAAFRTRLMAGLDSMAQAFVRRGACTLPRLKIRNLDLAYPIQQGGMGVGVSWEGLAGAVASAGCVGLVSAIGTGYHGSANPKMRLGRPDGTDALNPPKALEWIVRAARERSGGRGAVGVNILCAIEGYEEAVRASLAGGAQMIVSGAGLPLALPGYVGDADVALVPIVSSGRALQVICKQWQRKFNRLPDAVVLEGPESGGHQGFSHDGCLDPAHTLENILPEVIEERNKWGEFPILVAGGVWDHADIQRFLALGADGVQMGTRFIGTFECDASPIFKEVILRAKAEDIGLMKSPVGLPARGVRTSLQRNIEAGTAPLVRCVSNCLSPCGHGKGAMAVGYCIADRLADAMQGNEESGLFFTGSNGAKLRELVSVRDLIEELTQDPGLQRLYA
ncbi:nitronate monooxygenase family protein [Geothrix sp.]|uniref:NAD(P)H-dependent flavin oxidoreductase n=1 Tax=Geothrix sp. TaxID=1962974 RepID=UPI0025C0CDE0|nr:nitronate monooxygenase family protein [Geothrix sp.]WIL19556.1 MAG: nitronate monooxygenase family protein [Geothrix sp.]